MPPLTFCSTRLDGFRRVRARAACWVYAVLLCVAVLPSARAQWMSETYSAQAGWTAIWVPLDLSHTTIDEALAGKNDIEEIWRWNPPSGPQFVTDPKTPVQSDPNWSVWKRGLPLQSTLFQFTPNAAYLVKVKDGAATVSFSLKGRPVQPNYPWTTTGVNLVGFPTVAVPPTFSQFFANSTGLANNPPVLKYVGGPLVGSSVGDGYSGGTIPETAKNPRSISLVTEPATRGVAWWVKSTAYTNFYGPTYVSLVDPKGLNYGRNVLLLKLTLKNATASQSVTYSLTAVASEAPPAIVAGTAILGSGTTAGKVASINPDLNTGMVYTTPPTVTLSAPSAGTRATATAVLDAVGKITSFNVTGAGAGYGTAAPTVTVTPVVTGPVPLRVRGALNTSTAEYTYTNLTTATSPATITLAAGASTEVVLLADRVAMGGTTGQLFGSLLRVTDSLNQTAITVPVTALAGDFNGLWSGVAMVNDVTQIVGATPVAATTAVATATVVANKVTALAMSNTGSFYTAPPTISFSGGGGTGAAATVTVLNGVLQEVTITNQGSGYTAAPSVTFSAPLGTPNMTTSSFPVPLLVHRTTTGDTRLLQQVYLGSDGTTTRAATAENLFPSGATPGARLSVASLPNNLVVLGTGQLGLSGTVSFQVLLDYNSDANPFVHRYHPDHDNLDARFTTLLPAGRESFTVSRAVSFTFLPSLPGITDPAWGVTMLGGTYTETVTGLRSVPITVNGTFILNRVSDVSTLLTP
ncbi:MAG: hypothetical protein WCQ89_16570 [Verrucomicrobiota bacterium]|jgi:hypothetical protein